MLAIAAAAAAVVLSRHPPVPSVAITQPASTTGDPNLLKATILPVPDKPVVPINVAPAPVTRVTLSITSTPIGAEVYRGKDLLGTTPASIPLPPDGRPMVLELKKAGYKDREIEVTPDKDRSYEFELGAAVKKPAATHNGGSSKPSDQPKSTPQGNRLTSPSKPGAGKLRDLKDPFGDDHGH